MDSSWDKSLETGNAEIDSQHRELVALNDHLKTTDLESHDAALGALDAVMEFAQIHFLSEEELMTDVHYPAAYTKEMREQHQQFKAYARLRVLEFRHGEMLRVLPLQSFLDNWVKVHEFGLDRKLTNWIRRRQRKAA